MEDKEKNRVIKRLIDFSSGFYHCSNCGKVIPAATMMLRIRSKAFNASYTLNLCRDCFIELDNHFKNCIAKGEIK